MIGHHSRLRENVELPLQRTPTNSGELRRTPANSGRKAIRHFFNVRELITPEIMRCIKDAQCNTKE